MPPIVCVAALCAACTSVTAVQPSVERITPASALNVEPTAVRIEGSGFHFPITNDVDTGETATGALAVRIGDVVLQDAVWIDESRIEGIVPAELAPGAYDVLVTLGPHSGMLAGGFTVTALGAFSAPTVVTALAGSSADDDPTMTADGLELYFNASRPGGAGGGDIWVTTRASRGDAWTTPTPVVELNTASSETTPGVSADGLSLYLGSDRAGGLGATDIYVATRASRADPWSTPAQVTELATTASEHGVQPAASGLTIVFNSNRDGATQLYVTTRTSQAEPWGVPQPLPELASGDEADPTLAGLERVIVFHSTTRSAGVGGSELYLARRADATLPFEAPMPITELNSTTSDSDGWISEDLRYVLFTSDRSGVSQIYEASR